MSDTTCSMHPVQHHPWRVMRDEWPDWQIRFATLPEGVDGYTDHEIRTVWLSRTLDQAGRRSTLAHETQHIIHGHRTCDPREEVVVELSAARLLLPLADLVSALRWARTYDEAAEDLWVDVQLLKCRLQHLDACERQSIQQAILNRDNEET